MVCSYILNGVIIMQAHSGPFKRVAPTESVSTTDITAASFRGALHDVCAVIANAPDVR